MLIVDTDVGVDYGERWWKMNDGVIFCFHTTSLSLNIDMYLFTKLFDMLNGISIHHKYV